MKKILCVLTVWLLSSCKPDDSQAIKAYFKDNLKDPESFTIYNLEGQEADGETKKYVLDYGAKNGFGAMDRETVYVTIENGGVTEVENKEVADLKTFQANEEKRELQRQVDSMMTEKLFNK